MPGTNADGRCEECGCIPRPDIARLKNEDHCRCDPLLNSIFDGLQSFHRQNDENIKKLADQLVPKPQNPKK